MQSIRRFEEVDVQVVWIDNVGRFEVAGGTIIRCRRGTDQTAMKSTPWTTEETDLVLHALRTVTPQGMFVECPWQEKIFNVQVTRSRRSWVLRRKDGTVYQIHPGYASVLAREKFQELVKKEG